MSFVSYLPHPGQRKSRCFPHYFGGFPLKKQNVEVKKGIGLCGPQGAFKEIDEEGVMEVEACEDFLHIPRIKYCLYFTNAKYIICSVRSRLLIGSWFSPCAVQKVNLKQEKCHTLPHQYLCMSNKPTFYVIILNMFVFE